MDHKGLLVSNEVIDSRNSVIRHNISKWGYDNVIVNQPESSKFSKSKKKIVILVNAPCSGEGLSRKDPNSINEWSEGNLNYCSSRQSMIVSDILGSCKQGGILIFLPVHTIQKKMTCL